MWIGNVVCPACSVFWMEMCKQKQARDVARMRLPAFSDNDPFLWNHPYAITSPLPLDMDVNSRIEPGIDDKIQEWMQWESP